MIVVSALLNISEFPTTLRFATQVTEPLYGVTQIFIQFCEVQTETVIWNQYGYCPADRSTDALAVLSLLSDVYAWAANILSV